MGKQKINSGHWYKIEFHFLYGSKFCGSRKGNKDNYEYPWYKFHTNNTRNMENGKSNIF